MHYLTRSLWVSLVVLLFVVGATLQGCYQNTKLSRTDQKAYMGYAMGIAEEGLLGADAYQGGRNRMPLYPALISMVYEPSMSHEEYFLLCKAASVLWALVLSGIVLAVFWRVSDPATATVGTLVCMFTMFVYRAPYVQAELTYYVLAMLDFALLLELLRRPRLWLATLIGVLAGLTHMTKASMPPALALTAAGLGVYAMNRLWRARRDGSVRAAVLASCNAAACYAVIIVGFLGVGHQYFLRSYERFNGRPFYNVNSQFYIWYDNWEQVEAGTKAHGDRRGWPAMPAEDLPSMGKYLREHDLADILARFVAGLDRQWEIVVRSYGFLEFLFAYVVAAIAIYLGSRRARHERSEHRPAVTLFTVGYFAGYASLYVWYTPIGNGVRFMLSLFLPAMYLAIYWLGHGSREDLGFRWAGHRISVPSFSVAMLFFLLAYCVAVAPYRILHQYAGG